MHRHYRSTMWVNEIKCRSDRVSGREWEKDRGHANKRGDNKTNKLLTTFEILSINSENNGTNSYSGITYTFTCINRPHTFVDAFILSPPVYFSFSFASHNKVSGTLFKYCCTLDLHVYASVFDDIQLSKGKFVPNSSKNEPHIHTSCWMGRCKWMNQVYWVSFLYKLYFRSMKIFRRTFINLVILC